MEYSRKIAIESVERLIKRHNEKKDVELKSYKDKKREEREKNIKRINRV